MDNIWCGLPKPMATRQVKAMQHRKSERPAKAGELEKVGWAGFSHLTRRDGIPVGIMR